MLFCLISLFLYGCSVKDRAEMPDETVRLSVQEVPVIEYDNFLLKQIPEDEYSELFSCDYQSDCHASQAQFIETISPLPSGNWKIGLNGEWWNDGTDFYTRFNAIIGTDGHFLMDFKNGNYAGLLIEFSDGTVLSRNVTNHEGMELCINGKPAPQELQETLPYIAFMIYDNQYYKGADYTCGYYHGYGEVCWYDHEIVYALFRNTEKLTEYKYLDIFRSKEGFVAVANDNGIYTDILDDSGNLIRTEKGDTSDSYERLTSAAEPDPYEIQLDEEAELYYYIDETGSPICEPMFTVCTEIYQGYAVVVFEKGLYILEVKTPATGTASEVTEPLLKLKGCTLRECAAAYDPDADTFRKTYTALPSGDWLRQKSEDPVTDAYGNIVPLYNHFQIIGTNGQDKYPLETESSYHLMVLGFDDNRILRRDCTISENGELEFPVYLDDVPLDDAAAEEMPYTADMLCLNQYYRGSKRIEGCDCLYTDEKCDTPHQLKYALYRYTERLTDWKYLDLYYIGSSFVGVTLDENGEYISERLDMDGNVRFTEKGDSQGLHTYSKPKNEIVYDSYNLYTDFNTSNYYYSTSDGIKLTDPLFEEATQVNEGRAIVQYAGKTYHLTLDAWEQTQQEIAALDWCTLTRNTRYDGIIYRGRELDGALDKVFVPLPNGVWQYRGLTRTVMDKDDNLFSIYVQNTVLDENAESRYPLTADEYTFMLLSFDDGTDLRRVWRRFADGSKVYHKNDKGVTTTLQSEAPYMAEMIYKNQYYKGAPNICGCLNGSEVCYSTHRMRYALYKYTDRLTDWKYQELFRTEDAFVGVYVDGRNFKTDIFDDEGKVIRTEDGDTSLRYPVIPNEISYDDFLVMQDTETGKYYYAKPDGTPLCRPLFDECTRIAGGSAVVWIDNDVYLLKRKG